MKSLNELVNEIVKSTASVALKRRSLLELGLTASDVNVLLYAERREANALARERRASNAIFNGMTFGVEIECYNVNQPELCQYAAAAGLRMCSERYNHTDNRSYYKLVSDASISGNDPVECVTPILNGTRGFSSLKSCCNALHAANAKVNESTGLHVHVGGIENETQYINVFKNYRLLENLIDTFMANSRRDSRWARSLRPYCFDSCYSIASVERVLDYDRYFKVNPCSWARHRTIEFRQHQGSTNYEKIKMWARFCIKLVIWSKDNVLTSAPASIDEIPFLDAAEKRFFKGRVEELRQRTAEAA